MSFSLYLHHLPLPPELPPLASAPIAKPNTPAARATPPASRPTSLSLSAWARSRRWKCSFCAATSSGRMRSAISACGRPCAGRWARRWACARARWHSKGRWPPPPPPPPPPPGLRGPPTPLGVAVPCPAAAAARGRHSSHDGVEEVVVVQGNAL